MAEKLTRHKNLKVIALPQTATRSLEKLAQRTMTLQCTVQDGQIWIGDDKNSVIVELEPLYGAV